MRNTLSKTNTRPANIKPTNTSKDTVAEVLESAQILEYCSKYLNTVSIFKYSNMLISRKFYKEILNTYTLEIGIIDKYDEVINKFTSVYNKIASLPLYIISLSEIYLNDINPISIDILNKSINDKNVYNSKDTIIINEFIHNIKIWSKYIIPLNINDTTKITHLLHTIDNTVKGTSTVCDKNTVNENIIKERILQRKENIMIQIIYSISKKYLLKPSIYIENLYCDIEYTDDTKNRNDVWYNLLNTLLNEIFTKILPLNYLENLYNFKINTIINTNKLENIIPICNSTIVSNYSINCILQLTLISNNIKEVNDCYLLYKVILLWIKILEYNYNKYFQTIPQFAIIFYHDCTILYIYLNYFITNSLNKINDKISVENLLQETCIIEKISLKYIYQLKKSIINTLNILLDSMISTGYNNLINDKLWLNCKKCIYQIISFLNTTYKQWKLDININNDNNSITIKLLYELYDIIINKLLDKLYIEQDIGEISSNRIYIIFYCFYEIGQFYNLNNTNYIIDNIFIQDLLSQEKKIISNIDLLQQLDTIIATTSTINSKCKSWSAFIISFKLIHPSITFDIILNMIRNAVIEPLGGSKVALLLTNLYDPSPKLASILQELSAFDEMF